MVDVKTCPTCDGESVMYELPDEPYCDTCGGCGDVALDGTRLEVLSHGGAHEGSGRRFKTEASEESNTQAQAWPRKEHGR